MTHRPPTGAGGGSGGRPPKFFTWIPRPRAGPPWARLAEVGRQTREALADLPGWAVADSLDAPSAIVALRAVNGQDIAATRARLARMGQKGPPAL